MNILLTNDDGYNATGLLKIKELLKNYGTVYTVAPFHHMSGMSCSITIWRTIKVHKFDEFNYALEGTPADCVSFGMIVLGVKIDLVISGINSGYNLSFDTNYSGTVGAALQALVFSAPCIALSCNANYDLVLKYFDDVYQFILNKNMLTTSYFANVNFPEGEYAKGIKISRLYMRNDTPSFTYQGDEVHISRFEDDDVQDEESDCYLVKHHYISITPLLVTNFSEELYSKLK